MKREIEIDRRLRTLRTLREAVAAMKGLSARQFRVARDAVAPARLYREQLQRLMPPTAVGLPAGDGPAGIAVFGGELGLCGNYNSRLVAVAVDRRRQLGMGPTFGVGRRATAMLARRGVASTRGYSAPTGVRGIIGLLLRLAEDMLTTYVELRLSCFEIVSSRFEGVGSARPVVMRLLPFGDGRTDAGATAPVRYVGEGQFAAAAARELLYSTLYDLLLDAVACEHSMRLVATQSAEQWLGHRAERLRQSLRSLRREGSTQEILEVAAGVRAQRQRQASDRRGADRTIAPKSAADCGSGGIASAAAASENALAPVPADPQEGAGPARSGC